MHGLMSERFLKRFFGDLSHKHGVGSASETEVMPKDPDELSGPDALDEEVVAVEKTGEVTQSSIQRDASNRSTGDAGDLQQPCKS